MKWGLVELHVDLEGVIAPSQTDAVMAGIRRDTNRADTVSAALEHARQLGCGFVVLPGWTLVADQPPSWLTTLSAGMTVIAECLRPYPATRADEGRRAKSAIDGQQTFRAKGSEPPSDQSGPPAPLWESYVLSDGGVIIGPARQYAASSGDPWNGDELSERGAALVHKLQGRGPDGRRWEIPGVGEALLLCGEANIVGGGGPAPCRHYDAVEAAGLTEASLAAVRVVANPAHTWSRPQALRDKRAWLSRSGLLLHTANTHSAGWQLEWDEDRSAGHASRRAAAAWMNGELCPLENQGGDGYSLKTMNWSPTSPAK